MKRWYTVVGICGAERHAFHIRASSPTEAERLAPREHDEFMGGRCAIAGVFEGRHLPADAERGNGLERQGWSPSGRPECVATAR